MLKACVNIISAKALKNRSLTSCQLICDTNVRMLVTTLRD